jgi:hypothetical protein
LGLF